MTRKEIKFLKSYLSKLWESLRYIASCTITKYCREHGTVENGDHRVESDNDRLKLHTTSNEAHRRGSINFARDYARESKLDRTCQNKMTIDHRRIRQEIWASKSERQGGDILTCNMTFVT